jgi:hypothetical protein
MQVSVRKDDAALQKGVRRPPREPLHAAARGDDGDRPARQLGVGGGWCCCCCCCCCCCMPSDLSGEALTAAPGLGPGATRQTVRSTQTPPRPAAGQAHCFTAHAACVSGTDTQPPASPPLTSRMSLS